jgi:membrane protease subunit HflK
MSENDDGRPELIPIRGGKAPENPIDELKRMLEGAFKGRSKGPGGWGGSGGGKNESGGSSGNPQKLVVGFIVLVFVLWGILSAFYTVDVSEEGVVTRFGAYNRTTPSGMHFKFPFGVEQVVKIQSKRILQEEFGFRTKEVRSGGSSTYDKQQYLDESLMLTGDLNVADVEWIVQFRISDPWKYLFHARDVQRNIRDISMSIMRRVVGDRLVGEVLTTGRVEIADQAKVLTQEVLDRYDMGITIERVILQGVNPPEKVKPASNEVNAAKQEQEQIINVAEREYNRVIPEARGKGEKLLADTEGYAIDLVNRAKGNAAQFQEVLKAYKRSPDVTRQRLYLDAMEEIFSQAAAFTIVDSQLKGLLPIHNIQALTASGHSPGDSGSTPKAGGK